LILEKYNPPEYLPKFHPISHLQNQSQAIDYQKQGIGGVLYKGL
jgi:hypothetical protein